MADPAQDPSTSDTDGAPQPFAHVHADKHVIYRAILDVFSEAKQRFVVHLRPEDVADRLGQRGIDLDTVTTALDQLVRWGNLRPYPDTTRVTTVEDFNRLPIPYAAVAADIATGERVVLDRGDIVQAMRASMAIPVVFSPIEFDGRLLVDGGLVDNLPVSLARAMGADVIIAVDVTPPLKDRAELRDLFGISEQLVILLGQQDVRRQLSLADVGLDLKMDDVGIFDFRAADSIMARGALVARSAASDLSRWSLSESGYRAHLPARGRREPTLPDRVSEVQSDGPAWLDERLVHARVDPALADTLDPDLVEEVARGL